MFKTLLFLSIILKLALGEDEMDDEVATVELTMATLNELAQYIPVADDEIEAQLSGDVCDIFTWSICTT